MQSYRSLTKKALLLGISLEHKVLGKEVVSQEGEQVGKGQVMSRVYILSREQ